MTADMVLEEKLDPTAGTLKKYMALIAENGTDEQWIKCMETIETALNQKEKDDPFINSIAVAKKLSKMIPSRLGRLSRTAELFGHTHARLDADHGFFFSLLVRC